MVDAVNLAASIANRRYLQRTKARQAFVSNPTIRNRAFAPVMSTPPTITLSGTSSSLPGGSILRQPQECRLSNVAVYQSSYFMNGLYVTGAAGSSVQYTNNRKSYGYAGDTSMTVAVPALGAQLLRVEFDIDAADFEVILSSNGVLSRIWVNEQPATAWPVDWLGGASDGALRFVKVALPVKARYRIMLELERGFVHFAGIMHRATDEMYPPSLSGPGRVIWVGDSIGESSYAQMGNTGTPNASTDFYQAGGFVQALGHLLGLHDVWGGYSQGGTGFVRVAGNGSRPYGDRVAQDVIANAPDAVVFQLSTNDMADNSYPPLVQAAATSAINAVKAALPDCLVIGCGLLATPPLYGGVSLTNQCITGFRAALAATGCPYIETYGLFSGDYLPGGSGGTLGRGNADIYSASPVSQAGSPHPNQLGHNRIASFLAGPLANLLGLPVPTFQPGVQPTPSGYWET